MILTTASAFFARFGVNLDSASPSTALRFLSAMAPNLSVLTSPGTRCPPGSVGGPA
jgi:hypothetical protein